MHFRPPKKFQKPAEDPIAAALEQEVLAEKAGTLARLNKKLEAALANIPAADEQASDESKALRERHLQVAGEALWFVQIQRELCGLTRHQAFYDHMGVPKEVRVRLGPNTSRHTG
ncbi:DUF6665 family protein [Roseibium sp. RKSG952]|uniref:DUF6665 family protein n=1 Tax=Roseibium sp. RKSG952 TaxID=2529384 RepID=UPI0012BC63B5|nr:DUF6665 family protein [Roseibium sp. RKSG952]MTH98125.1 hypothetical protein [Roseibium sp. RKSG952]